MNPFYKYKLNSIKFNIKVMKYVNLNSFVMP